MGNQNNVVKFKKRKSINLGVIVFLILFLYIAINVYIYFTKDQLSIYEVHEGSTAIDNRITALILRDEEIVKTNRAGYVTYYQKDGARVAKNASIFSVDETMRTYEVAAEDEGAVAVSDKNYDELRYDVKNFLGSFSNNNYDVVYDFQEDVQSTVLDIMNNVAISQGDVSASTNTNISEESGIITYYIDNYESITPESVTEELFQKENYNKTSLKTAEMVALDTPVYKIITSDVWKLVLPLEEDQFNKLQDKTQISFEILDDDLEMKADLELLQRASSYYAVLTLDKKLTDYLGERFLDVKLDFDTVEGLKIPLSSIVEKTVYKVPSSLFTMGANSTKDGLTQENYNVNGDVSYTFIETDIYYKDDTYTYIDSKLFPYGTWVHGAKPTERYKLEETVTLKGVYNVNQGYAVFKYIEILSQDEEYCIINNKTKYGLSAYDQIALDGSLAVEQEIIY